MESREPIEGNGGGEGERNSGKRKLDDANGSEGSSDEEGFSTGRVRRMRVSENVDKNGGAAAADVPPDGASGTDCKAPQTDPRNSTAPSTVTLDSNPAANPSAEPGPDLDPRPENGGARSSGFSFPYPFDGPSEAQTPDVTLTLEGTGEGLPTSSFPLETTAHAQGSGVLQMLSPVGITHEEVHPAILALDGQQRDAVLPSDGGAVSGPQEVEMSAEDARVPEDREGELAAVRESGLSVSAIGVSEALEHPPGDVANQGLLRSLESPVAGIGGRENSGGQPNGDDVSESEVSGRRSDVRGDEINRSEVGKCEVKGNNEVSGNEVSGEGVSESKVNRSDVGGSDVSGRAFSEGGTCERCGHLLLSSEAGPSQAMQLQLFVKLFDGRTILVRADPSEFPESVLERVRDKTGVDCLGQRLLYNGRELIPESPLATFNLGNGCTLTLASRLRSSTFPWAFTLTERLLRYAKVALDPKEKIGRRETAANTVTHQVASLLENARHIRTKGGDIERGAAKAGVVDVFRTMGGPKMLHALLQSPEEFCRRCAEECINGFVAELQVEFLVTHKSLGFYCLPILADVWADLLSGDSDHTRDVYEQVTEALLNTLSGKSQWLLREYFRLSKREALELFVGMLEQVKDRLYSLTATINGCYTLLQRAHEGWLQPLVEARAFGILSHVVVAAMHAAGDEIVHSFDELQIDSRGERQYTRAAWEGGGLWSRLGDVYVRLQNVLDPGFYTDVAAWWSATSSALFEWFWEHYSPYHAELEELKQSTKEHVLFARVARDESIRQEVNRVLGGRVYHILDGLHAFNFGGSDSPFFPRFEALLSGHELEIDSLAFACPEDKAWMFDEPACRHLAARTRVSWFLKQFPEPEEGTARYEFIVPRGEGMLRDTLAMMDEERNDLRQLQRGVGVVFDGEEAEGPGVTREWFTLVARELFSEEKGLFLVAPGDKRRVLPNPESDKAGGKDHLELMRLAGHVLGLSILHRFPLGILPSSAFYKGLTRQPLSWPDARDICPDLYRSCRTVMDLPPGDVETLGLTFSADVIRNGTLQTVDLVPNGGQLIVTGENRGEYLDRLVTFRLQTEASVQVGKFYLGFSEVIAGGQNLERALTIVGGGQLEEILASGAPEIDVSDWKLHTEYSGYTPECDQVRWFWQAVEEMTSHQRRQLLYFATAVAHLPLTGFAGLPHAFRLHRAYVDVSWLPTAHTCFHLFMLPPYTSYEMMRERLFVVTQDHIVEGFGFV